MELNLTPVTVDIFIETPSLSREAFYNICFITENDIAPRTIEVRTLGELLENGYKREDLAYNFCVGVFIQQSMPSVFIRAKRSYETYEEAFSADDNSMYYYVVIESKDKNVISNFNDYLNTTDDYKLQFYSSNEEVIVGKKLVHYFFDAGDGRGKKDFYLNKTDIVFDEYVEPNEPTNESAEEVENLTPVQLQQQRLAYPEAAWISACGEVFPSHSQWLYKYLAKVDVLSTGAVRQGMLELGYTTTSSTVMKNTATVGSGKTAKGILIHEQVSLDWVKWAISKNIWNLLYTKDKLNATNGGKEIIVNAIKDVLNVAVREGIFTEYHISEVDIDSRNNNISVKFTANLEHTILAVGISGSLYY